MLPRERLVVLGPRPLAPEELVALLLGTGTPERDVCELSHHLIVQIGGLGALSLASSAELCTISGIGEARASRLVAAFELGRRVLEIEGSSSRPLLSPQDVFESVRSRLAWLQQEVFWAIALNARSQVIEEIEIARGTLSSVEVHPREVFRPLVRRAAYACVVVHNHPSGDPEPSSEDIELTRRLAEAGAIVGIPLLDHVVVSRRGFVSISDTLGMDAILTRIP